MRLAMAYFFSEHQNKKAIARQLGVTEAVIGVPMWLSPYLY